MATPAGSVVGAFCGTALVLALGLGALTSMLPGTGALAVLATVLPFALGAGVSARGLERSYPHARLGLANTVTLVRLALTAALFGQVVAGVGASWLIVGLALVTLCLDGLDGWCARRQGLSSRFGARFDMEVDSALALVLALGAALGSGAGVLALALGLPRYLFVLAASQLPWMRADLPERFSRKAVCVIQIAALIALQAPIVPPDLAVWIALCTALLLVWSFARDLVWLRRQRA